MMHSDYEGKSRAQHFPSGDINSQNDPLRPLRLLSAVAQLAYTSTKYVRIKTISKQQKLPRS